MTTQVLRFDAHAYVLDAFGLTRVDLGAKPKAKTVCSIDNKHAGLNGGGAGTSFNAAPNGQHALICESGFNSEARIQLVDLPKMTAAGKPSTRNLAVRGGAGFVADDLVVVAIFDDNGLVLEPSAFDATAAGGLGDRGTKVPIGNARPTTLAVAWEGAASPGNFRGAAFLRMAGQSFLCVSQPMKKAWGGVLRKNAAGSLVVAHAFEIALPTSPRTRVGGACFEGRAFIEVFDATRRVSEIVIVAIDDVPTVVRQLRIETSSPTAFDRDAVYAYSVDGTSINAYDALTGTKTNVRSALEPDPSPSDLFAVGPADTKAGATQRLFRMTRNLQGLVDARTDLVIDRKPPGDARTLFTLALLPYGQGDTARPEPFTLSRNAEIYAAAGSRVELASFSLSFIGAASGTKDVVLRYECFHDGALLGRTLDRWLTAQRSARAYRFAKKSWAVRTELVRKMDADPSAAGSAPDADANDVIARLRGWDIPVDGLLEDANAPVARATVAGDSHAIVSAKVEAALRTLSATCDDDVASAAVDALVAQGPAAVPALSLFLTPEKVLAEANCNLTERLHYVTSALRRIGDAGAVQQALSLWLALDRRSSTEGSSLWQSNLQSLLRYVRAVDPVRVADIPSDLLEGSHGAAYAKFVEALPKLRETVARAVSS